MFRILKTKLLEERLEFKISELEPLTVFQHLKNSLHNKRLHYDKKNKEKTFKINGYDFNFRHEAPVQISWDQIAALLIANCNLLLKIIEHQSVSTLSDFSDLNFVLL